MMKRYWIGAVILSAALFCGSAAAEAAQGASSGEEGFTKNCAVCHPNGGNIIKPDDTLDRKALEREGIRTPGDIVKKMRNPGPGMTKFDTKMIHDAEANAIAEYILKTFK